MGGWWLGGGGEGRGGGVSTVRLEGFFSSGCHQPHGRIRHGRGGEPPCRSPSVFSPMREAHPKRCSPAGTQKFGHSPCRPSCLENRAASSGYPRVPENGRTPFDRSWRMDDRRHGARFTEDGRIREPPHTNRRQITPRVGLRGDGKGTMSLGAGSNSQATMTDLVLPRPARHVDSIIARPKAIVEIVVKRDKRTRPRMTIAGRAGIRRSQRPPFANGNSAHLSGVSRDR